MKKFIIIILLLIFTGLSGQERIPQEVIPPSGKISLSRLIPFYQAIQVLSEISSRTDKKVIIDEITRPEQIGVDIVDLHWREALKLILQFNNLESEEYPNYIKIVDTEEKAIGEEEAAEVEYTTETREVNISAIFFEGNRHELIDKGINWQAIIQEGDIIYDIQQTLVGAATGADFFSAEVIKETSDKTLMAVLKAFESESMGEILANPNISVIEGKQGVVQVGQDFSVKQRDFAGNVTDAFIKSGILLTVTPKVILEDSLYFIYLEVQTEKSSATPGALSTTINKTTANTSLLLLDGEKAVIAGLYSVDETSERGGIPLLKDLPGWFFGLRYLFGYDRKEHIEKELIIIIKAELLPTLKERKLLKINDMDYINQKREELKKNLK